MLPLKWLLTSSKLILWAPAPAPFSGRQIVKTTGKFSAHTPYLLFHAITRNSTRHLWMPKTLRNLCTPQWDIQHLLPSPIPASHWVYGEVFLGLHLAYSHTDCTFGLAPAAAAAKSLQSCPTVWPDRWQPTRLPRPWDSPGKNTGVGCHFLLQCRKVKSESEVAQSCPTLRDPMDCSLPGSSAHGIFQARVWAIKEKDVDHWSFHSCHLHFLKEEFQKDHPCFKNEYKWCFDQLLFCF